MVGRSAVLPIVLVISHFMSMNTVLVQNRRHRVIKRFQRPPRSMKKIVTTGMHFPSGRHTRHGTYIEVFKLYGFLSEPFEVRCIHPIIAIARQKVAAKCVIHDNNTTFHLSHVLYPRKSGSPRISETQLAMRNLADCQFLDLT